MKNTTSIIIGIIGLVIILGGFLAYYNHIDTNRTVFTEKTEKLVASIELRASPLYPTTTHMATEGNAATGTTVIAYFADYDAETYFTYLHDQFTTEYLDTNTVTAYYTLQLTREDIVKETKTFKKAQAVACVRQKNLEHSVTALKEAIMNDSNPPIENCDLNIVQAQLEQQVIDTEFLNIGSITPTYLVGIERTSNSYVYGNSYTRLQEAITNTNIITG